MNVPDNNILLYESLTDVYASDPYTILDAKEANRIILRFGTWRRMIETHPHLVEPLEDQKAYFISLLTGLADAVQGAKQAEFYPKIVLPESRYRATMMLLEQARDAMPEVKKLLEESGALDGW